MLDDVKENTENIDVNRGNIADNAKNLQHYFKGIMNVDAITLINNTRLETPVGCGLKGSEFKILLIFLSWSRHGTIVGYLGR